MAHRAQAGSRLHPSDTPQNAVVGLLEFSGGSGLTGRAGLASLGRLTFTHPMVVRGVRSGAVFATVLICGATICAPQAVALPFAASPPLPAAPGPGMDLYADPVKGWSISYPVGWQPDTADPALVRIRDPENQALVAIRVAPSDLPLNAAANQLLASQAQELGEKGLTWALASRYLITFPNGTPAVEVRGDILPGGRAHQLYLTKGGKVFGVSAETAAALWGKFSADFEQILMSFAPPA